MTSHDCLNWPWFVPFRPLFQLMLLPSAVNITVEFSADRDAISGRPETRNIEAGSLPPAGRQIGRQPGLISPANVHLSLKNMYSPAGFSQQVSSLSDHCGRKHIGIMNMSTVEVWLSVSFAHNITRY